VSVWTDGGRKTEDGGKYIPIKRFKNLLIKIIITNNPSMQVTFDMLNS
jgi:hypothetical protein